MRNRTATLAAAALLVLAGCGSDNNATGDTGAAGGPQPTFVLTEFDINVDGTVPSGQVDIKIDNRGAETHEVVIVAAENPATLPVKADGSVDEDKIPDSDKSGESGDVPAQTSVTKSFTLKPGTYVAFCNIIDDMAMADTTMTMGGGNTPMGVGTGSGHVHFDRGMSTTFVVK